MRRLDGISAQMIYSDIPRCYQHTLKISFLDFSESPGGYDPALMMDNIEHGVGIEPFLRWKIARVPFGLNHPVWVQDLEFDLSNHVRRIACPAPGDKRAFCQLVSELYAQSLPQSRPLWMVWLIEGLENDQVASVLMLHHAYMDGVGAGLLLQKLASKTKPPATSSASLGVNPNKNPSSLRLLVQGALELPLLFTRTLPSLLRDWRRLKRLKRDYQREGRETPPDKASSPVSPLLNAPYSHGRTFYYESLPLEQFRAVAKSYDATINDLLLAVIAGAIRNYHQDSGWSTDEPLIAAVPVNMRGEAQKDVSLGNHVSDSAVTIPIHLDDAIERLELVKKATRTMKEFVKATQGISMARAAVLLPPLFSTVLNWVVSRSKGKITPFGNFAVSNVPGPRKPLSFGPNIKVSDWLSIGQASSGVGLNLTAWSYVDRLNICMMANKAAIEDGEHFFGYVTGAFEEYLVLHQKLKAEAGQL